MSLIRLTDIVVRRGSEVILDIPTLVLERGSQTLLTGGSGSGKSTLIHLLAGFLRCEQGSYDFETEEVSTLSERSWDRLRALKLGVVFQHYPLLRGFSLLDNLLIPMAVAGNLDVERAKMLLKRVGLEQRHHHRPAQLSAGQRQRAALVRALINRPALVLADEPTAHLDPESAEAALALLQDLVAENESTLLLVSHDHGLVGRLPAHLRLEELQRSGAVPA